MKKEIKTQLFLSDITKESAYTLGLLWADGYIEKGKYKYAVTIECLSEDMEYFSTILSKTGSWSFYNRTRKNRKPITKAHTTNKIFNQFLISKGYKNKSYISPNEIVKIIPESLRSFFILGVIDGDGCFYFNQKRGLRQFTITGTLNQDWALFEEYFSKLSITYKIIRKENQKTGYSQIRVTNRDNINKLGDFIYNDNLGLPRKKSKYLEIIN
jgi:hypothetical protein